MSPRSSWLARHAPAPAKRCLHVAGLPGLGLGAEGGGGRRPAALGRPAAVRGSGHGTSERHRPSLESKRTSNAKPSGFSAPARAVAGAAPRSTRETPPARRLRRRVLPPETGQRPWWVAGGHRGQPYLEAELTPPAADGPATGLGDLAPWPGRGWGGVQGRGRHTGHWAAVLAELLPGFLLLWGQELPGAPWAEGPKGFRLQSRPFSRAGGSSVLVSSRLPPEHDRSVSTAHSPPSLRPGAEAAPRHLRSPARATRGR